MFWLKLAFPLFYLVIAIYIPTLVPDKPPSYFAYNCLLFFLPAALLAAYNWNWIKKRKIGWPILNSLFVGSVVSFFFEFVAIGMHIWTFGPKELYIGYYYLDVPIEEFMFYWGAAPACLFLYLYYYRVFEQRVNAKMLPFLSAWLILSGPFLFITFKLYRQIRERNTVSWPAITATVVVFFLGTGFVEYHAIQHKYWIYDFTRLWGKALFGIPFEEYLIYYWLGPTFIAIFFHHLDLRPEIVFGKTDPSVSSEGHGSGISGS